MASTNIDFDNTARLLKVKNLIHYIYSIAELEESDAYTTLTNHKKDILSKSYCEIGWNNIKELISLIGNCSTEEAIREFNSLIIRNKPKARKDIQKKLKKLGYELNPDFFIENQMTLASAEARADAYWKEKLSLKTTIPVSAIDENAVIRLRDKAYFKTANFAERKTQAEGILDSCNAFRVDGETGVLDSNGDVWMYAKDYYTVFC